MNYNTFIIVLALLFSSCLCDITEETRDNNDDQFQPEQGQEQETTPYNGNEQNTEESIPANEQVIPIGRRDHIGASCVECSSYVNPQAAGVDNLAKLGVRHLNFHEPTVKHSLESIIAVQRQVQIMNGVRYTLTLSINFDNCTEGETDTTICASNQICKITVLEKPWQILTNGAKFRSILANNCTEEWLFGDNGEVLPEPTDNQEKGDNSSPNVDGIKVEHYATLESQPSQQKILTVEEMKALEQQIIPYDVWQHSHDRNKIVEPSFADNAEISKDHVNTVSSQRRSDNNIPITEPKNQATSDLSQDKKKAIDAMFDFFNFADFRPRAQEQTEESVSK